MLDVIWDMETGDPDDYFTLLLLAGHPDVNLKAVTVAPGAPDQMGLVKRVLDEMGLDLPLGAFDIHHPERCVSDWYHELLGGIAPYTRVQSGAEVIHQHCDTNTTIVTGAPLHNLGAAIEQHPDLEAARLVAQGGFAGQGVVPPQLQLDKFKGLTTCPTYNLNGAPEAALAVLTFDGIATKRLVAKNVCHGVFYDAELHTKLEPIKGASRHLEMIYQGMDAFLRRHPAGKKFHDPLAACAAIDESIIEWREVVLFRKDNTWGSRLCPGSDTWISVDYDREMFEEVLLRPTGSATCS